MSQKEYITPEYLHALFIRNGGVLYWRKRLSARQLAGAAAGFEGKGGRWTVCFRNGDHSRSRLIWMMFYGCWPQGQVFHKNGDPADDRIKNLALVQRKEVTPEYLHELFTRKSGVLYWKVTRPGRCRGAGQIAGSPRKKNGRCIIGIHGTTYYRYRLIWAMHYGHWPTKHIDHINHDPSDDRIKNLRDVSHQTNLRNHKGHKTNKSGHNGVHQNPCNNWVVQIKVGDKTKHIGTFKTKAEAVRVRKQTEKEYWK